jgi:hypothetical protein
MCLGVTVCLDCEGVVKEWGVSGGVGLFGCCIYNDVL